jgi:hypothetical protein
VERACCRAALSHRLYAQRLLPRLKVGSGWVCAAGGFYARACSAGYVAVHCTTTNTLAALHAYASPTHARAGAPPAAAADGPGDAHGARAGGHGGTGHGL